MRARQLPCGPSGTGKSHLVEALAHAAIEKDLRVAWFTLETLTATIGRAKADGSIARTVARICRSDLIVVDDIGMLPAGQEAAEAFYRITDAAYERRSMTVTSNIHPSKAHLFTRTCARQRRNITGLGPAQEGADLAGEGGHLLACFDPGGNRRVPVLIAVAGAECPGELDVAAGVEACPQGEAGHLPLSLTSPPAEVGGQPVQEVRRVSVVIPDPYGHFIKAGPQPVRFGLDCERRAVLIGETRVEKPDAGGRVLLAADCHLR
jgi:hypothetical protein